MHGAVESHRTVPAQDLLYVQVFGRSYSIHEVILSDYGALYWINKPEQSYSNFSFLLRNFPKYLLLLYGQHLDSSHYFLEKQLNFFTMQWCDRGLPVIQLFCVFLVSSLLEAEVVSYGEA